MPRLDDSCLPRHELRDFDQATELYGKACDGEEARGRDNLSVSYQFGRDVLQDDAESLKYYGKACDFKEQKGCDDYAKLKRGRR